jgi:hypothetical protein
MGAVYFFAILRLRELTVANRRLYVLSTDVGDCRTTPATALPATGDNTAAGYCNLN